MYTDTDIWMLLLLGAVLQLIPVLVTIFFYFFSLALFPFKEPSQVLPNLIMKYNKMAYASSQRENIQ